MSVTKIRAECSHMPRHCFTITRALLERPDSKCVAQVVNAATAKPRTTAQPGRTRQIQKRCVHCRIRKSLCRAGKRRPWIVVVVIRLRAVRYCCNPRRALS